MILGGLVKNSTLDYPSRLSAVVFTQGCNFHCPYCHNPALVPFKAGAGGIQDSRGEKVPENIPASQGAQSPSPPAHFRELGVSEVLAFLRKRQGLLDGVVVTGGEPTCQDLEGLREFLASLKKMGYPVKLDTNGSRPKAIQALLEDGLVDYLAVDVKAAPGGYPASVASRASAGQVAEALSLAMEAHREERVKAEFRTTCFSPVVDESVIMDIASKLQGNVPLFLQPFRPGSVLDPSAVAGAGPQPSREDLARWAAKASALLPCRVR